MSGYVGDERGMSFCSSSACFQAAGTVARTVADGRVELELEAPRGCRGCDGLCAWRRLPATRRATFATSLPLAAGDRVVLSLPGSALVAGALLAYGMPFFTLLAGALAGWAATASDAGAIGGAVSALAAAPWLSRALRRRAEQRMARQLTLTPGVR